MTEKGSKKLLVLDVFLIIIFVGSLSIGAYTYFKHNTTTANFSVVESNDHGQPTWNISYNLTSDVFSAQEPITIGIYVALNPSVYQNDTHAASDAPSKLYMYFPMALSSKPQFVQGHELNDVFVLQKQSNSSYAYYSKTVVVKYPVSDVICPYLLTTSSPVTVSNSTCPPVAPTLLTLSSAQALYQYQTNKTTVALAWIVLAFTAILIRDVLLSIGKNSILLYKYRR